MAPIEFLSNFIQTLSYATKIKWYPRSIPFRNAHQSTGSKGILHKQPGLHHPTSYSPRRCIGVLQQQYVCYFHRSPIQPEHSHLVLIQCGAGRHQHRTRTRRHLQCVHLPEWWFQPIQLQWLLFIYRNRLHRFVVFSSHSGVGQLQPDQHLILVKAFFHVAGDVLDAGNRLIVPPPLTSPPPPTPGVGQKLPGKNGFFHLSVGTSHWQTLSFCPY